jgi:putative ABC transport system permease protein
VKNNNQRVIRKLSMKSLKKSKMRNLFAVVAIVLTTVLFTTVFTLGMGLISSMEKEIMRQVGTSAHAGFKDLTREEYDKIKENPTIKDISYNVLVGMAGNQELAKRQTEIRYGEIKDLEWGFRKPEKGTYPQEKQEILVDTIVLDMMGIPRQLGEKITLEFNYLGHEYKDTFTVSGIYEGDFMLGASQVYLSKEYVEEVTSSVSESERKEMMRTGESLGEGLIQAEVFFNNSRNIEEKAHKVLKECGFAQDEIDVGVNWAYLSAKAEQGDSQTMVAVIFLLLLIGITGYLVIYNIFQISIVMDIRFYGLLKTLGATKKQIRSLVRRQALFLSAAGIPVGLLLGWFLGIVLTPVMLGLTSDTYGDGFTANPVIFIGAALFSLITVLISCRKPGKAASNVSPVEAVKYVEGGKNKRKRQKVSSHGGRIYRMALANVFRYKKKAIVVITSLSLSVILLLSIFSAIRGFSIDKYMDEMICGDLNIGTADYFHNFGSGDIEVPGEYVEYVNRMEGIEASGDAYISFFPYIMDDLGKERLQTGIDRGYLRDSVPGYKKTYEDVLTQNTVMTECRFAFDPYILKQLNVLEGELDLDKFNSGKYVLAVAQMDIGNQKESFYHPGDKVKLRRYDTQEQYEKRQEQLYDQYGNPLEASGVVSFKGAEELPADEYEVMAVVELGEGIAGVSAGAPDLSMVVPREELERTAAVNGSLRYLSCFQISERYRDKIEAEVEQYTSHINPQTDYRSRKKLKSEFMQMMDVLKIIGGALCLVVGIVGILNYVNSTLTGIITRRKELAMMKSIGMTDGQQKKMLIYEGLYYVVFIGVISAVGGSLVSLFLLRSFNRTMRWFEYQFTLLPVAAVLPFMVLLAVVIPVIMYRRVNKTSIVERLRE